MLSSNDLNRGHSGAIRTENCLDWLRRNLSIISRVSNKASSLPPSMGGTQKKEGKK